MADLEFIPDYLRERPVLRSLLSLYATRLSMLLQSQPYNTTRLAEVMVRSVFERVWLGLVRPLGSPCCFSRGQGSRPYNTTSFFLSCVWVELWVCLKGCGVYLPSCSIQGLRYTRVVLSPYLYLSSFSFS